MAWDANMSGNGQSRSCSALLDAAHMELFLHIEIVLVALTI